MARRKDKDGLYKRERSPYWWASYTDASGKRIRRSTGARTKGEAQQILDKWRTEVREQKHFGAEPIRTFDELMLKYLNGPSTEKRAPERDQFSAKQLFPHFTEMELNTMGPADVQSYIDQRRETGAKPSTINKELNLLSAALNYAKKRLQWRVPNPVEGMRLREPEGRIRWITREQYQRLLEEAAHSRGHLVDFVRLGVNTGMRKGEMLGLEWSRVDLKNNLAYLTGMDQKSGRYGSVPLNSEARVALLSRANHRATHCPDSPWVFCDRYGRRIQNIKKGFASACQRAGIEDFHPHDLRHTCATWLVQAGVSIREVAEILRHSDIRMTMRYAHLAPDNVRSAVEKLTEA